jgi:hypothetical protein
LNKHLFALTLALVLSLPLAAVDYGIVSRQQIDGENAGPVYTFSTAPWLSASPGEQLDLYFSAGYTLSWQAGAWLSVPEISRFFLRYRPRANTVLEAGRIAYRDIRGSVASGLFDGLSLSLNFSGSRFSVRALYTGLLYKETADIAMTAADREAYRVPVNYDGGAFVDTYFASRRFIGALGWESPEFGNRNTLAVEAIGQADLNPRDDLLHSGYVSVRYRRQLMQDLGLELGGTAALAGPADTGPALGLSASGRLNWDLPKGAADRLSLDIRYTSGETDTALTAFPGITMLPQGFVLRVTPEGLALVQGEYRVRLHQALSWELGGAYVFRTGDTAARGAFGAAVADRDSPFLGAEFRTAFIWVPFSDLSFNLDCGVFVPQWGTYFDGETPLPWRVRAGLVFSF